MSERGRKGKVERKRQGIVPPMAVCPECGGSGKRRETTEDRYTRNWLLDKCMDEIDDLGFRLNQEEYDEAIRKTFKRLGPGCRHCHGTGIIQAEEGGDEDTE